MHPTRYQHLLHAIRDLEDHTDAANTILTSILKTRALDEPSKAHSAIEPLLARIGSCAILARQIATDIPQALEVRYD